MKQIIKWLIPIICLMIIWGSVWVLFYLKADEVTKDPCGICAKRMGQNVQCTQYNQDDFRIPATRIYYPNGTIYDVNIEYKEDLSVFQLNMTGFNFSK